VAEMKNVYFVQVDVSATMGAQSAYLPYTAGILAAHAWTSETVKRTFRLRDFVFLRQDIAFVAANMESPAIVAFSNYCWNTEYNKALAAEVKRLYPECITVFGGHNVPDDFSFLEEYPTIDILCHGEGEDTIKALFETIAENGALDAVPNISFRKGNTFVRTKTVCQKTLDYPSPYLEGLFDPLVAAHPEITFNAILETSRGCPMQCAYCDWGMLKSKVRLFPIERIKKEILWMSENKIAFVWGADANFGMFDRDLEIADFLVKTKEETGYPERMRMNYAKNRFENVFAIVKKFKECAFDRNGATLSFQSLSPVVLKNIGRANNDLEFYKNLLTAYNKENMKAYSELILGLPGETYESFMRGIGILFEIGQHFAFQVYGCMLLPNSVMGRKDYVKEFGIKTVRSEMIRAHVLDDSFSIPEYSNMVVETASMPREMWVRSFVFCHFAAALHAHGLLRVFAIYLYINKAVPYERFYDGLLTFFEKNSSLFAAGLFREIWEHVNDLSLGKNSKKLVFAPCGDIVWDDYEYIALRILASLDQFYAEILPYLQTYSIEPALFEDLLAYQKNIMRTPLTKSCCVAQRYDIHGFLNDAYVNDLHPVCKKKHTVMMRDSDPQPDWKRFGKQVIWYGRMGWASYKDDITITEDDV